MNLSATTLFKKVQTTFYGWDGDRLVLTEQGDKHIHTIYEPNSFIPLMRIEGKKQPPMKTLAQKVAQHTGIKLIPQNIELFHRIEQQMRQGKLDEDIEAALIRSGVSVQMLREMLDSEPTLEGKTIHFYHCDHLGTPIALINQQGEIDWQISLDPWGNVIKEHNPKNIHQPIRFQGQQFDEESGLHYNRHRYYDPRLGRYITQDPIGLAGEANLYGYVVQNPINLIDPKGLYDDGGYSFFVENFCGPNGSGCQIPLQPPASLSLSCPSNCDCDKAYNTCLTLTQWEGPVWSVVDTMLHGLFKGPTSGLPSFDNPYDEKTLNRGCEVGRAKCMARCASH